jgi:hypothetical protein
MANVTGREALIEQLEQYALECLKKLEEVKEAQRQYNGAKRALAALGLAPPAPKKGGPRKRSEPTGLGTGVRPPGTTIGDKVEALLRARGAMTVNELAAALPKGTPRNSVHSAFRAITKRGVKLRAIDATDGRGKVYGIKA